MTRVGGAFTERDPLLMSRGWLTYRELLDSKRGRDFEVEVPDKIKETACTIVVLVLGDDDFSCLKQGVVVKSVEYDDMFEDPRAVVRWCVSGSARRMPSLAVLVPLISS